jgi:NMD protein affecting ribosome stability and mRNA decay
MSETRPATEAEIVAYKAGKQDTWKCPECGRTVEILGALMVFCEQCRVERKTLVQMSRI